MSLYQQGLAVGASDPSPPKKGDSVFVFIVLGVITVIIFGLSPGARYFYRHGRLPPSE